MVMNLPNDLGSYWTEEAFFPDWGVSKAQCASQRSTQILCVQEVISSADWIEGSTQLFYRTSTKETYRPGSRPDEQFNDTG